MENEKKIRKCNIACKLLGIALVVFEVLWIILASVFSDTISTTAAGVVCIAIILGFGSVALFMAVKANRLSPVVSGRATVTDKHVSVGHPNEYMVAFTLENGDSFIAYGKLLYDAVFIGECDTLTTQGSAFISFGGRTMKDLAHA